MLFDQLGTFVLGVGAIALAAPCLALAATERPPAAELPRVTVLLGGAWALAFTGAALYALVALGHFAVFGLFVAATELAGAGALWAARSRRRRPPPADGGGPPFDQPPYPPDLPENYWDRWEESLREPRFRRSGPRA